MQDIYKLKVRPQARKENIVQGEKYRITLLTEGLVRLEYSEEGIFEDRATRFALYRDFPKTEFRLVKTEEGIEIQTSRIHLIYNEKEFSSLGLSIQIKGNLTNYYSIWHYGEEGCPHFMPQLRGTARTLDEADGAIPLESGVIASNGYAILHDSSSQVLLEDGWIEPRKKGVLDIYFFGYGHDYKEALKYFYYLSGHTPMLPRYALGNWWSRYYRYTEKSYMELMERFERENIPFTVAVIDMDWHLVDIDSKYGSGWTGYTWNKELFPDPKRFLDRLHDKGMHITLNVHPADGVRGHEEMYFQMAKEMGVDYEKEDPILCDPANPNYVEAYFKYLHHPREEEGVDFWWIDWQQGNHCKVEGLDPLWIFNHYHFLDNKRNGKRPMTFSRYAGPGSHRYPIGFSGDTWITWDSLDFQPYFTASATNIGYGWWSHDIGGHMGGCKDDELTARWVQSGLYSPIMRLHSSCSEFNGKEPWRFKKETEKVMQDSLRLRHQMIPYLYTMNYRSYKEGMPLIMPMYYDYPEVYEAYQIKNQFMFGTQIMVVPITSKRIPGLAKAGAILPFTDEISAVEAGRNPLSLRVKVYAGADGNFELYEDDNETCRYENDDCVKTRFVYTEAEDVEFVIKPARGNLSLIPGMRSYHIEFYGFEERAAEEVSVTTEGQMLYAKMSYDANRRILLVQIPATRITEEIKISIKKETCLLKNPVEEICFEFLNQAEIEFFLKDQIYGLIQNEKRLPVLISRLQTMNLEEKLLGALMEILTAKSM